MTLLFLLWHCEGESQQTCYSVTHTYMLLHAAALELSLSIGPIGSEQKNHLIWLGVLEAFAYIVNATPRPTCLQLHSG